MTNDTFLVYISDEVNTQNMRSIYLNRKMCFALLLMSILFVYL